MKSLMLAIVMVFTAYIFNSEDGNSNKAGVWYGDCPTGCSSIINVSSGQPNCVNGTWSGPGGSGGTFTTDSHGNFTLPCRCSGLYSFCVACGTGPNGSITVDGSSTTYNLTLNGVGCFE